MKSPDTYLHFSNRDEWRAWLQEHHAQETEAWLVHYKKGVNKPGVVYEDAVEEALCFGWVDGLLRSLDAERYILRYSPRKANSVWAESNKRRIEKLIQEGRMTQAGLDKVAQAKVNGQWDAAARREDVDAIPPDLEQTLRQREGALAAYQSLPPSHKKQYVWWLAEAKTEKTRLKRIEAILDRLVRR